MELRFSVTQAIIVCLVLIVLALGATAVLIVALLYYKVYRADSQKAVDLAGQNLSMKGESRIEQRIIKWGPHNAKKLPTRPGRKDEVWHLLLNIAPTTL